MLKSINELVKRSNVDDFYTIGYVDNEKGIFCYHPDLRLLYLEINSKYIEFESIEQYSKLSVKIVERMEHKYKESLEDEVCISSMGDVILVSTQFEENRINKMIFYGLEDDRLICDALELMIREQMVFLDPGFLIGIGIGGIEQKQYWKENYQERIFPYEGKFPELTYLEFK